VPRTHTTTLRVRYAETDRMGVVYHANYLAWCEVGRTEFVRAAGMSYRAMEDAGVGLAVIDAQMRFHGGAAYDDVVRIDTRLSDVRSRVVGFEYLISNAATGAKLVTASTRLASVTRSGATAALPPVIRTLLEHAMRDEPAAVRGAVHG
jgi:acyl-CoA thioester hydrolase